MGQYRTLRNKQPIAFITDEDGNSVKVPRSGKLAHFNSVRTDTGKHTDQMLQRHATKGDRGLCVRRARAQQIMANIQQGMPMASNLGNMKQFITNNIAPDFA